MSNVFNVGPASNVGVTAERAYRDNRTLPVVPPVRIQSLQQTVIKQIRMIRQPSYTQQYHRPYHSDLSADSVNEFMSATNDGQNLTGAAINSCAYGIIAPTVAPGAAANIANGFAQPRFAVLIEVVTANNVDDFINYGTGNGITEVFICHTDYDGANIATQSIDPNMVIVIDSCFTLSENGGVGMSGNVPHRSIRNNLGVIPRDKDGINNICLRPTDVVGQAILQGQNLNQYNVLSNGMSTTYISAPYHHAEMASGVYLSNSFRAIRQAYDAEAFSSGFSGDVTHIMSEARTRCMTQANLNQSAFMNTLALNDANIVINGSFKYRDLLACWPTVDDVVRVANVGANQLLMPANDTADWGSAVPETQFAYSISMMLPGIMLHAMVSHMECVLTNQTLGGEHICVFAAAPAGLFDQQINIATMQMLEDRLIDLIVNGIVERRASSYEIKIRATLYGACEISVSLNGGYAYPYATGLTWTSAYSCMVGSDRTQIEGVASAVDTISRIVLNQRSRELVVNNSGGY